MKRVEELAVQYGVSEQEMRSALREQSPAALRASLLRAALKRARRSWRNLNTAHGPAHPTTTQAANDVTALAAAVYLAERKK